MRVHFIAVGGAAMHNLAIALHLKGYQVTGSDDAIYEPSKSRLQKHGLLPEVFGWYPEKINKGIDAIILGMHAKADNPELIKAQELDLPVYSYPEYIYEQSRDKTRVVVGGSHGKTTITSMVLHVLKQISFDFDYLVGAQIEGFDNMVKLSDAPCIIIEGDEYLASPIDRRPKFHLYKANIGVISGIAWDHVNVFPTFENYKEQFSGFIDTIQEKGTLIYCEEDEVLSDLIKKHKIHNKIKFLPYKALDSEVKEGNTYLKLDENRELEIGVFGKHNLMNLNAAKLICNELGISDEQFFNAIVSFKGASKRLEKMAESDDTIVFRDFAHSPSKLKATVGAVKNQFSNRDLVALIELHTFSSVNKDFISEYKDSMKAADVKIVFVDETNLIQKKVDPISESQIKEAFNDRDIIFFNNSSSLERYLLELNILNEYNVLLMSSGNFGGIDLVTLSKKILKNRKKY
ncbi:Mur ligase middle domain protein [Pseudopedobacter saltans DSM 12145]|uniref:Mur ligase middle domain protein n=1 Tax=Pseudopedobacter saltans (strain ATCC 51119 / DSM 12145 / JCM 21818 / CCUG 39354 / LMG 10337 / NBRC 100064 / NCIMB 13643) TaxID=762903 RepID=F0SEM9_PSESL|nr:Mur ligase family protein [Pseudopedobacter saltans]ADY51919.1 Mur ligase middle domain protein [Pseudopedobacter saltans DSM 12145]